MNTHYSSQQKAPQNLVYFRRHVGPKANPVINTRAHSLPRTGDYLRKALQGFDKKVLSISLNPTQFALKGVVMKEVLDSCHLEIIGLCLHPADVH